MIKREFVAIQKKKVCFLTENVVSQDIFVADCSFLCIFLVQVLFPMYSFSWIFSFMCVITPKLFLTLF